MSTERRIARHGVVRARASSARRGSPAERRSGLALALGLGGAAILLTMLPIGQGAAQSQQPGQSEPPAAAAPPAGATASGEGGASSSRGIVHIFEWINRSYAPGQAASVMAAPSDSAETIGRLRPGVGVLVVGLVAGGQWLQIRLPDGATVGYVHAADFPAAVGKEAGTEAPAAEPAPAISAAPAPAAPSGTVPAEPASNEPSPAEAPSGEAAGGAAEPSPAPSAISGHPTVLDTGTLAINNELVPLYGIDGFPGESAAGLQQYIAANGDSVSCQPEDQHHYVCLLPNGTDVAMAALINGAALLSSGAPDGYRNERDDALRNHRGIWGSCGVPEFTPPVGLTSELLDSYLAWIRLSPLYKVEVLGDGGFVVDGVPYAYADGAVLGLAFDAARGGWGFLGRDGGWRGAPDRVRAHLDEKHPRGEGVRLAGVRGGGEFRAGHGEARGEHEPGGAHGMAHESARGREVGGHQLGGHEVGGRELGGREMGGRELGGREHAPLGHEGRPEMGHIAGGMPFTHNFMTPHAGGMGMAHMGAMGMPHMGGSMGGMRMPMGGHPAVARSSCRGKHC